MPARPTRATAVWRCPASRSGPRCRATPATARNREDSPTHRVTPGVRSLVLMMLAAACAPQSHPVENPASGKADGLGASARPNLIYLAVTDRFSDGDPSNDRDCFDPADPQ